MAKIYIDADRLKAEIERRNLTNYCGTAEQYEEELFAIIDSLQQEQPEVGLEKKFTFPKFLFARTLDNKTMDISYAPQSMEAVEYVRNDFIEQEQSEEDLEKEIDSYFKKWWMDLTDQGYILRTPDGTAGLISVKNIARHFYSLGQQAKKDLPEWKKAYAGTHFGEDVVTISPKGKDFPRVVETALTDCLFIPISELMKLAKKED